MGWGTNTKYSDLLNVFFCNDVSLSNQDYKCDINIRNVDLKSPANNAHVSPPTTFSWAVRSTSTDSYAITFFDGNTGEVVGGKSGLGYIGSKTFSFTNFSINALYAWKINVSTPDGIGLGFNDNNIYFNNMNGSAPNAAESLNSGAIQLSLDASEGSLENALKLRDWLSPVEQIKIDRDSKRHKRRFESLSDPFSDSPEESVLNARRRL